MNLLLHVSLEAFENPLADLAVDDRLAWRTYPPELGRRAVIQFW